MSTAKKTEDSCTKVSKEITVLNKNGIHARPAAMFVKLANRFTAEVFVEKDGEKVNGKSIMGLMMLAAGPNSRLLVEAVGTDALQAVAEIEKLIKSKFNEE
ncbi:phosphocarrier protein HPr [Verrucomicrobiota bacterium]|nr:phosphocarrier protein HPr [Verrucomicrobiota bacterium]